MEEETKMHDMKRQIYETERWKTDRQCKRETDTGNTYVGTDVYVYWERNNLVWSYLTRVLHT